ncbi:MAG: hypothetical protein Q4G14_01935 [Paracoccus sp. (in: a-proteobacteria)]|uniref:hypothetical protein n=1 Tax=Paracoccus sp. TaxID=267 RepID=UPI0026E0BA42|nr:hypothetical protein [Paracoccus sp. (in: a-proteobacteria)]MDO5611986.1 hypothetical protein [Paracoccus sp. (in: a-proteobacteria)]
MGWLARALAGPTLWSLLFAAVYALHGTGCNLGWPGRPAPIGDLHHFAMWAVWAAGLLLHVLSFRLIPAASGRARVIVTAGLWIGLVATAFTLFPVIAVSTCA